jgi:aminobenzoyl-glutamate utilization protein B
VRGFSRFLSAGLCGISVVIAAPSKTTVFDAIERGKAPYESMALSIWDWAEVGFKEHRSSALLQDKLKAAGFAIESGVAGMPTAFVATAGSGKPVIGVLAEFDALPGLSQEAIPERKARSGGGAGHACGHHLFGVAAVQAAVAVKEWLATTGSSGTVRVFGTPAEEGGSGKVYMVRAGLFADTDVALHWHPSDRNGVNMAGSLANISGKFRFRGVASHAAAAPDRGRSALDGVESMNHMVNLLREHVPETTRIHYVVTRGGEAPNVVPADAESYYYVRSPSREIVKAVWQRVVDAAQGAAMGTGTSVTWEITGGVHELLPNEVLGRIADANLRAVGGVRFSADEMEFARRIGRTLYGKPPAPETAALIPKFVASPPPESGGSTDVGDVSWAVPTVGFRIATWAPGTPAHSWQAVACGGSSMGLNGMIVAAKTLAGTMLDLIQTPSAVAAARAELTTRRGETFNYEALLGARAPALDYRN